MGKNLIPVCFAAVTILLSPFSAYAYPQLAFQSSEINLTRLRERINTSAPLIITKGFESLVDHETKEAFEIWLNASIPAIRNNISVMSNTMQGLLDNTVGKCIGYYVIDTFSLTSKTKIIYVESQHEEGAFFWRFTVHETPSRPIITSIDLNTDPSKVIPLPSLTGD